MFSYLLLQGRPDIVDVMKPTNTENVNTLEANLLLQPLPLGSMYLLISVNIRMNLPSYKGIKDGKGVPANDSYANKNENFRIYR